MANKKEEPVERPDAARSLIRRKMDVGRRVMPVTTSAGSVEAEAVAAVGAALADLGGVSSRSVPKRKGTAEGMRKMSFDLPPDLYQWTKRRAVELGVPTSTVLRTLLSDYRAGKIDIQVEGVQENL